MLTTVANKLKKGEFRKSEAKVAQAILKDPEGAIQSSIANLAKLSDVSEPTVNRFCTNLNCKGFPDFKLQLAQSLASGNSYAGSYVTLQDSTEEFTSKVFDAAAAAITRTRKDLDLPLFEQAIDSLAQAKKIEIYGLGASGSVAQDAQHKFFRLNIPVIAHVDELIQRMSAAATQIGDVVVLISNTGRTISIVKTAEIAHQTGATVIGITAPDSPLAKHCHLLLAIETEDDTDMYTPTTSRLAHLVLIDALATGVALKRGPRFAEHLEKIKSSLTQTRYPKTPYPTQM